MLYAIACQCGGADGWIRSKLRKFNYPGALAIPITKGKDKALSLVASLPQTQEVTDLAGHIQNASKFAIIIGTDGDTAKWVDVANGHWLENDVNAEFIIRDFS